MTEAVDAGRLCMGWPPSLAVERLALLASVFTHWRGHFCMPINVRSHGAQCKRKIFHKILLFLQLLHCDDR